ncbi:low temperature requirement protein A [Micrococcales bacterium 31B]|nr:low temperature requirement protein A [Micrococcales bacterium 31B]
MSTKASDQPSPHEADHPHEANQPHESGGAKPVPWVELYFDLVIVFSIGKLAANIGHHPTSAFMALGLLMFLLLWWSWIGFTLLYNRWGDASRRFDVIALLVATAPMALIGIGFDAAFESHFAMIGAGLAGTRLLLAILNFRAFSRVRNLWVHRISSTYAITAALFIAAAFTHHVGIFAAVCAVALGLESGSLLARYRSADDAARHHGAPRSRREPSRRAQERRKRALDEMHQRGLTADLLTINPEHLAERFHLFLIIVLGEIIIASATGAALHVDHVPSFIAIFVSGLTIAASLGWLYFQRHAHHNEHLVSSASGAADVARNLYASGLLLPVFGLVLVSAGLEASTGEHAEPGALLPLVLGIMLFMLGMVKFRAIRSPRSRVFLVMSLLVMASSAGLAVLDFRHAFTSIVGISFIAGVTLLGTLVEGAAALIRERKPSAL